MREPPCQARDLASHLIIDAVGALELLQLVLRALQLLELALGTLPILA